MSSLPSACDFLNIILDVLFFMLQHQAYKKAQCKQTIPISRSVRTVLNTAVGARNVDYFEVPNTFCTNTQLQQYFVKNKYVFHPCGEFKKSQKLVEECEVFSDTAPPAYEVRDKDLFFFFCASSLLFFFTRICAYLFFALCRSFKRGHFQSTLSVRRSFRTLFTTPSRATLRCS